MRRFFKHPWIIVTVITLITVFFAYQLRRAELDNNNMRFVPETDRALQTSRWIDDTFGSSFFILVGLERTAGTVFEGDFLGRVRDYIDRISEIPIVDNPASLISSDYITSVDDAIVVEKLTADDFSGSAEEIAELRRRLLSWDLYKRALVSDDFTAIQILVPLSISAEEAGLPEVSESFLRIRDIAWEMLGGFASVYVTGMPVIAATVNEAVSADLRLLVPLVVAVVLGVLFFSFRRFTPVVLPLLTVLVAVIWSVGAMPVFGIRLSVITTVLPVILVAVGSAYGIHMVTHYLNDRGEREMSGAEHRDLVFALLGKIRKPVFLAALTTFAAFSSFCFTSVAPIREFGYFAAFGVAAAFLVAMTLIPALLLIRGPKKMKAPKGPAGEEDRLSAAIAGGLVAVSRKRKIILFATAALLGCSIYGLSKVIIDNVMVEYFKSDTDIFRSDVFIREQFGGSKVVSVVAQADSPEILLHPDTLSAMDGLASYLETEVPNVGKVMGFTSLIKRINQVYQGGDDSFYEIPVDPARYRKESPGELGEMISNYMILLSGDISQYADDSLEPLAIKSTVQLRTLGMADSRKVFAAINDYVQSRFPQNVRVTLGGTTMVEDSLNDLVVQSQLISLIISGICVFLIIALSNRSLAAGCIGAAPLSLSVLINFAVMGFFGIKLNLGTSMVAGVSVGVGIDYAIHYLESYKREYRASGGKGDFLLRTFIGSGKAIIINALSVGVGFAVLLFSRFNMLGDLGLLIAITMFSSALVSLTVLPALLMVFKPKFIHAVDESCVEQVH
jgi:predicted RND superfamily exporter protein